MVTDTRRKEEISILFLLTIWIFFSLNARYIQLPKTELIRWVMVFLLFINGIQRSGIKIPSFLMVFAVAVIPSLLNSDYPQESLLKALSFLFLAIGFYSYFYSIPTHSASEKLIETSMWVIIIYELLSAFCIIRGIGYDGARAIGITTNSNTLGIYSNLALLSAFYFNQKRNNVFFIIVMLLSVWTSIACGSRTAFISLALNIVVIVYIKYKGRRSFIFAGFGLAVIACLIGIGVIHIDALDRLLAVDDGSGALGTSRTSFWLAGIRVWKEHPVFGCGYSISKYLNSEGMGYAFHNSYLSILAETGIWGATSLLLGMVGGIFRFFKSALFDIRKNEISIVVAVSLMMVELLLAAYSESFLFAVGSTEGCLFWVLFFWNVSYCVNAEYWNRFEEHE